MMKRKERRIECIKNGTPSGVPCFLEDVGFVCGILLVEFEVSLPYFSKEIHNVINNLHRSKAFFPSPFSSDTYNIVMWKCKCKFVSVII